MRVLLSCCIGLVLAAGSLSAEPTPVPAKRQRVGRAVTEDASLLRRQTAASSWQVVREKEELAAGDLLLLIGPDAALESANGAVRLAGLGEMTGVASYPVLETAIVLHESTDVDLDVTLDRGRIVLRNQKQQGAARVRLRIRDKSGLLVLREPGTQVAAEIYGRWLPGAPFRKDAAPTHRPALAFVLLALKGTTEVDAPQGRFLLHSPPGRAVLVAEDLNEMSPTRPQWLEKLPAWADGEESDTEKKQRLLAQHFRKVAARQSITAAVDTMLGSQGPDEHRAAIYALAAMDDLKRLGEVLAQTDDRATWDAAVIALRHWLGRGPGQDQKLYQALIDRKGYKPAEAEIVLGLLHSFGEEDRGRPELYEALIDYLQSKHLAIRGLAYWHLYRLVPAGRKIGYDPVAPTAERKRAVEAWRKLIPSGKMPPRTRK